MTPTTRAARELVRFDDDPATAVGRSPPTTKSRLPPFTLSSSARATSVKKVPAAARHAGPPPVLPTGQGAPEGVVDPWPVLV
ncbi:hypothetical protein [Arthrobacter sp. MMS24-S77]